MLETIAIKISAQSEAAVAISDLTITSRGAQCQRAAVQFLDVQCTRSSEIHQINWYGHYQGGSD